jgi:DNA-binding transcriptional ArsR family regulator
MPRPKSDPAPKELSAAALELIASRFRALSEPMRLRILSFLMQGERTVGQIVEHTGSSQANISKHIALLRGAGMLGTRKEGLNSYCFIADPIVNELCDMMCSRLRQEMEDKAKELLPFDPQV